MCSSNKTCSSGVGRCAGNLIKKCSFSAFRPLMDHVWKSTYKADGSCLWGLYTKQNKHNLQTFPLEEVAWIYQRHDGVMFPYIYSMFWEMIGNSYSLGTWSQSMQQLRFKFNKLIKYVRKRWTTAWLFNYCWLTTELHIVQVQIIYANRAATSMWIWLE